MKYESIIRLIPPEDLWGSPRVVRLRVTASDFFGRGKGIGPKKITFPNPLRDGEIPQTNIIRPHTFMVKRR